jgi:ribosomal protein L15E
LFPQNPNSGRRYASQGKRGQKLRSLKEHREKGYKGERGLIEARVVVGEGGQQEDQTASKHLNSSP